MDLKTLMGENYKEAMTIEEINAFLSDKTLVDPTTLPKTVTKETFDHTASEAAKYKRELNELKTKSMTDDEKISAALKEAETAKSTYAKKFSELKAREVFVAAGLSEKDYEKLLDTIVSDDETATKSKAQSLVDLIASQKAAIEKAVRAELMKETPKAGAGNEPKSMTKEKFDTLDWQERGKLKLEQPELFKQFNK